MLGIGDNVQIGKRGGAIQRWGVERGLNKKGLFPVKATSRKKAIESGHPMIEVWFPASNEVEWWPLDAVTPIQSRLY